MTDFKMVNTKDMQMFSLMQAMGSVGYELMRTQHGGLVFFNQSLARNGNALMSVHRAVKYYNDGAPGLDAYSKNIFDANKVMTTVKIQYSKRRKQLIGTGNMVKFVKPEYEAIFLELERQQQEVAEESNE